MSNTLNITFSTANVRGYLNTINSSRIVINQNTGETLDGWLKKQGSSTQLVAATDVSQFPLVGNPNYLYLDQSSGTLYVFLNNEYTPTTAGSTGMYVVPTKNQLPVVGNSNVLYVIERTNEIFRWSDSSISYLPCAPGVNREELDNLIDTKVTTVLTGIEVIQGGTASGT